MQRTQNPLHILNEKTRKITEGSRLLNAIFKTAVDAIVVIDDRGIIQMVNPAVTTLFGYDDIEMIGNNVHMLMPNPHRDAHNGYMENYHRTGIKKIIGIGREVPGKRKDGSIFPLRLAVSEVNTDHGSIYVGMLQDLTDRKKIEEKLKSLNHSLEEKVSMRTEELSDTVNKLLTTNKKLETAEKELLDALAKEQQLNELKSRFVSMASHEFRTPLSTILSSVALIGRFTESDHQPKREKHVNRIKSAVTNLTGILNDFLSISKLEEGKIESNPEEFEFNELCGEVKAEIEGLLKKGQKIFHESDRDNQILFADRRLIKNVLFNLISNAIKYSPENKPIFCKNRIENGEFILEVTDQGIGIPKEDQKHMFDRFFRAGNVTNIQGTGLGLHIVVKYVELMKGKIGFESEQGEGSTFWVRIPMVKQP